MSVSNKPTFKNDLLAKQITKLTDEALKPMSIIEIKEKFNLNFPFQVKRVKDSFGRGKWEGLTTITEIRSRKPTFVTNNEDRVDIQNAEVQDYILFEKN